MFVEIPLFVKAIEKAYDGIFFKKLIKDNIALIAIIIFIINFWSFSLLIEFSIVPITILFGLLYALAAKDPKLRNAKLFLDKLIIVFSVIVIVFAIKNIILNPNILFNINTLKEFLLPIFLLFLNLPVVYGLALFNVYEQIFIRLKGNPTEKRKMKKRLFIFANVNLYKISTIRNKNIQVLTTSLTDKDMEENLDKLNKYLNSRVGDNYMKRANFYKLWCIIGFIVFIIVLIICNCEVGIKDIIIMNFVIDVVRIKEIISYICSTGIVLCSLLIIYSIGYKKKRYEEISQVKKYALHGYLYLLKRQFDYLEEFIPIDEPQELFTKYIVLACELKSECDKIINSYDNLLSHWELESIKQLQLYTGAFVYDIHYDEKVYLKMNLNEFEKYYEGKIKNAPQNEKINTFTYSVTSSAEKYVEQVRTCYNEFKNML